MANNIVQAVFTSGSAKATVKNQAWQYDYGQKLRISGLALPAMVEIHFSLTDRDGESVTRIGSTADGVTDVVIPDSMLENGDIDEDYTIFAWVFLTAPGSGETEYKIEIQVRARARPEVTPESDDASALRQAEALFNDATRLAESYAVGGTGAREGEDDDNAKAYAERAETAAASAEEAAELSGQNAYKNGFAVFIPDPETEVLYVVYSAPDVRQRFRFEANEEDIVEVIYGP